MSFTLTTLKQSIQDWTENDETTFVNELDFFIKNAEERILKSVDLDYFRKNVTGTMTSGIKFLEKPSDYLATFSLSYVKDRTLDFCKKQVLKQALEDSVKAITSENYESVLSIMKDAVFKGSPSTIGHEFFKDHEARFAKISRVTCPTGMPHLDKKDILNGRYLIIY